MLLFFLVLFFFLLYKMIASSMPSSMRLLSVWTKFEGGGSERNTVGGETSSNDDGRQRQNAGLVVVVVAVTYLPSVFIFGKIDPFDEIIDFPLLVDTVGTDLLDSEFHVVAWEEKATQKTQHKWVRCWAFRRGRVAWVCTCDKLQVQTGF